MDLISEPIHRKIWVPLDTFGPEYPKLGEAVAKFRRKAKAGIAKLPQEDRKAYGEAVLAGVRALQHAELMRACATPTNSRSANCASGTALNDGAAILEAVRSRIASSLHTGNKPLYGTDQEAAYKAAMEAKQAAVKTSVDKIPAEMEALCARMSAFVIQAMQPEAANV